MAADLVILPTDPGLDTHEPRILASQLSGFAVLQCACGHPDPLILGTLGAVGQCPSCRERYIIGSADFAVDPISKQVTVHLQVGRLSSLSRPMPRM